MAKATTATAVVNAFDFPLDAAVVLGMARPARVSEGYSTPRGRLAPPWVGEPARVVDNGPVVRSRGLGYSYEGANGPVNVLDGVDFDVQAGEFLAILGPSGSGKSSFLNLIGGIEKPTSGEIWVAGHNLATCTRAEMEAYRQTQVAFVFQFFNLLPTLTAFENVLLGVEAMAEPPVDRHARVSEVLASVGLANKAHRLPSQLSGGEQQRVAVARALAKRAPIILADEPTGNLDEATAAEVVELFVRVQAEYGSTLILITHDSAIARRAGRTLRLHRGNFTAAGEALRPAGAEGGK